MGLNIKQSNLGNKLIISKELQRSSPFIVVSTEPHTHTYTHFLRLIIEAKVHICVISGGLALFWELPALTHASTERL